MNNNKKSGFVSVVILLVVAFIIMKYKFNFDILDFVFNKEYVKIFDDKIVYYFNLFKKFIVSFFIYK